jgi:hypothetical protein
VLPQGKSVTKIKPRGQILNASPGAKSGYSQKQQGDVVMIREIRKLPAMSLFLLLFFISPLLRFNRLRKAGFCRRWNLRLLKIRSISNISVSAGGAHCK